MDYDSWLSDRISKISSSKEVKNFICYQLIIKNIWVLNAELYKINSSNLALSFTRSSLFDVIDNWLPDTMGVLCNNFLICGEIFHTCNFSQWLVAWCKVFSSDTLNCLSDNYI